MTDRRLIVAIGQYPPPITGFSYITQSIVDSWRETHDVLALNIAAAPGARGVAKHVSRIRASLAACATFFRRGRRRGAVCYIACEGGLGLVYTLLAIAVARLRGCPILLHHHSFAYIDRPRALMRAVLAIGGPLTHVFLCATMRDHFEATYRRIVQSEILSNAAFVPPQPEGPNSADHALVLGHLSNLTREKGLYVFLDLVKQAVAAGIPTSALLAGPVALAEDRAAIEAAVDALNGTLAYRGPLYGADKDRFYREIDFFIFPTTYANEAQPTVIFEAQAAGCLVIAAQRGCIANQVAEHGLVIERAEDFTRAALEWLADFLLGDDTLASRKNAARKSYLEKRRSAIAIAQSLPVDCGRADQHAGSHRG